MALPSSGAIWLSQMRDEFGNWGPPNYLSHYYRGALTTQNNLGVPTAGAIYFSHLYGAVRSTSGSQGFGVGISYMAVPPFQWLTIDVRAGGGGGGGANIDWYAGTPGGGGGPTHVTGAGADVYAGGGAGGQGSNYYAGVNYPGFEPRAGDGSGNQGAGGGVGGAGGTYGYTQGQRGGYGGRTVITYYPGQLAVGQTLTINVGGGGPAGGMGTSGIENGGNGAAYINWG